MRWTLPKTIGGRDRQWTHLLEAEARAYTAHRVIIGSGIRHFDLLRVALMVKLHQRIVTCIRRAADPIPDDDDPISEINCSEDGGKYADVRFRSADNEAVGFSRAEVREEVGLSEGGIAGFINHGGRRAQLGERRQELQQCWFQVLARGLFPSGVVALPHSGHVLRTIGRDEPREYRSIRISSC